MKYKIIVSGCAETLEMQVNEAIANGWKLFGGISVAQSFQSYENSRKGYTEHDTEYTFAQAMTLESDSANNHSPSA